ncbi:MAG: hypothetical protein K9K67_12030 [Bacteriovoracaceae bacterium]|nr:hypothetical protein [Bacteriovoracaceae bacterium]
MKSFLLIMLSLSFFVQSSFAEESKTRKKISETTKNQVIAVLKANESLHASFFDYKGDTVEKAAKDLKSKMSAVEDKEISKLLKFSITKLDDLKKDSEREQNNQDYHLVSMALIHLVNTYDIGEGYNAYSCPMVKKKWVQNSKLKARVHNPYAPEMPHCGTQDTEY